MRYATMIDGGVASLHGDAFRWVVSADTGEPAQRLQEVIEATGRDGASSPFVEAEEEHRLDPSRLDAPVRGARTIWAAAKNFPRPGEGGPADGVVNDRDATDILESTFLKPSGSLCGPNDGVRAADDGYLLYPEVELCVVIGRPARNVRPERALDHVFGYTILVDMTARPAVARANASGMTTRCVRKGYETFSPLGPSVVTIDELADPHALTLELAVNGVTRSTASTSTMINSVATMVSYLSGVCGLEAGDLIATGNPDPPKAQTAVSRGDVMEVGIDRIGRMQLTVI